MKQFKYIIFGLVFGAAGLLIGMGVGTDYSNMRANNSDVALQSKGATCSSGAPSGKFASMMIDAEDALLGFTDISLEENDTVYTVLARLADAHDDFVVEAIDYGDLGVFINSINGKQSGDDNNYWQFWVNNQYADAAADKYVVKQGDVIFWKFTSNKYETYE